MRPESIIMAEHFLNRSKLLSVDLENARRRLRNLQANRLALFDDKSASGAHTSLQMLETDVFRHLNELLKIQNEIVATIKKVSDPVLCSLLTAIYINHCTLADVAEMMSYDERHIYRLKQKALAAVAAILAAEGDNLCDIDSAQSL